MTSQPGTPSHVNPAVSVYRDTDEPSGPPRASAGPPAPPGEPAEADPWGGLMDEEEEEPDQWGGLFDDEKQAGEPQQPAQPREPPEAYSPADPGYGPPDASWYERRQREREEEENAERGIPDESQARGMFEPPPKAEPDPWGSLFDGEEPDFSRDPLGQVKSLYQTAESLGDDKIDRRFEELLERQRNLIGAFLQQSRPEFPERAGDVPVTAGSDARRSS
jgi:hypothetical protein